MNKEDKPWTRRELTLRLGVQELAKAVIEQWIRDGKPETDRQAIEYWYSVAKYKESFDK